MTHYARRRVRPTCWSSTVGRCVVWATIGLAVALMSGCSLITDEFRATAVPALQTGVQSILTGLVDGLFAVVDPGTSATSATTTGP